MKRPEYLVATVAAASRRRWNGWIFQEKLDGRWHERTVGCSHFVGELMPDGEFRPFDVVSANGQNIANEPASFRIQVLSDESIRLGLRPAAIGSGIEFLEAILANGGEGVVAKRNDSAFGRDWTKIKRRETHDCIITDIHGESISITEHEIDRGRCPVVGGKLIDGWDYCPRISTLNVGDTVEVACHSIHPSGKFREPRFVRVRDDKVTQS